MTDRRPSADREPPQRRPVLVVTVDTEEEGLWSGQFVRAGNRAENVALGLPRFQELCKRYGIKPTYLIDAPVLEDRQAVDLLRSLVERDGCEIGAHLHPWCTPPFEEHITAKTTFLCNLEPRLQRAKMEWLTEQVQNVVGVRPTSFRAGRYGIGPVALRALQDLGYVSDSSVLPFADYSSIGGPNFTHAPVVPHLALHPSPDRDQWGDIPPKNPCPVNDKRRNSSSPGPMNSSGSVWQEAKVTAHESAMSQLVEVPVASGYTRWPFHRWHYLKRFLRCWGGAHLRLPGLLDRLNIARYVKFSPEQANLTRLKQLVDVYCAHHLPVMVMMLHSSSLVSGLSPYCRNDEELEEIYRRLEGIFDYCIRWQNMPAMRLTECARSVLPDLKHSGNRVA